MKLLICDNTPASYLGGLGFDSRSLRPSIPNEGFRGLPQSLQANSGRERFLLNPFQLIIIHLLSYHRRYIL
jgi:hypothetical protein